jgi:hypothetical protein
MTRSVSLGTSYSNANSRPLPARNIISEISHYTPRTQDSNPKWTVTSTANNWRVETLYETLLWDDIVLADFARPTGERLRKSFSAFFDFLMSGAVLRYFKANWQYGLFFLFPYLLLCLFAAIALVVVFWITSFIPLPSVMQTAVALVMGIVIFLDYCGGRAGDGGWLRG